MPSAEQLMTLIARAPASGDIDVLGRYTSALFEIEPLRSEAVMIAYITDRSDGWTNVLKALPNLAMKKGGLSDSSLVYVCGIARDPFSSVVIRESALTVLFWPTHFWIIEHTLSELIRTAADAISQQGYWSRPIMTMVSERVSEIKERRAAFEGVHNGAIVIDDTNLRACLSRGTPCASLFRSLGRTEQDLEMIRSIVAWTAIRKAGWTNCGSMKNITSSVLNIVGPSGRDGVIEVSWHCTGGAMRFVSMIPL